MPDCEISLELTANLFHLSEAGCSGHLSPDDLRDGRPLMPDCQTSLELTANLFHLLGVGCSGHLSTYDLRYGHPPCQTAKLI